MAITSSLLTKALLPAALQAVSATAAAVGGATSPSPPPTPPSQAASASSAASGPPQDQDLDLEEVGGSSWESWLQQFGHDSWRYPDWVARQRDACVCSRSGVSGYDSLSTPPPTSAAATSFLCADGGAEVQWAQAENLTWCVAMHFLLNSMPEFDLHYLPPSVSVEGRSMLDDNVAFALMAWRASAVSPKPPLKVAIPYLLPYATFHESRQNWRPMFFAKYFPLAAGLNSSRAVVDALIADNVQVMSWTKHQWTDFPGKSPSNLYELGPFASGTAPPALAPFDVVAYGYASCTGWSKMLSSALKAVGIPAREAGSPCWNTGDFAGLATDNKNVSFCWAGGKPNGPSGGVYLNDHTWIEYWDNLSGKWRFLDSASSSSSETTWFCGKHSDVSGCECSSNAGKASADHWILAPTWSAVGDDEDVNGGTVIDVGKALHLSTGEGVSPIVWASKLSSPLGTPLKDVGLRVVNRTWFYSCKTSAAIASSSPSASSDDDDDDDDGDQTDASKSRRAAAAAASLPTDDVLIA